MQPKDKANELIKEYIEIMPTFVGATGFKILDYAKNCALITVNEMIKCWVVPFEFNSWEQIKKEHENLNFWQDVKTEIINKKHF